MPSSAVPSTSLANTPRGVGTTDSTDVRPHDKKTSALREWRDGIRAKPGIGQVYKAGVFVLGLACILLGFALVVLPGPLTIPPIILGLWIWSSEFGWAKRLFKRAKKQGQEAWAQAKEHPVSATCVTVGGLIGVGVGIWAAKHYNLMDKALAYLPF